MSNIHQLETSASKQARLLEQWVTEITSKHPNEVVAQRWTELARETCRKFPGPPTPSQSEIDLDCLQALTEQDKEKVFAEVGRFASNYMSDVRDQLMDVHRELLTLQKKVAELEQQRCAER